MTIEQRLLRLERRNRLLTLCLLCLGCVGLLGAYNDVVPSIVTRSLTIVDDDNRAAISIGANEAGTSIVFNGIGGLNPAITLGVLRDGSAGLIMRQRNGLPQVTLMAFDKLAALSLSAEGSRTNGWLAIDETGTVTDTLTPQAAR